jgi:hypothetical protein
VTVDSITAVSKASFELVSQYIFERLPSDADGFKASLGYQVLSRLSHTLSRLPYASGQQPDHLDDHRRDVKVAPALLEDLSKLLREGYLDGAKAEGKPNKKNMQRGNTQRSKAMSVAHTVINDRLFQALGCGAPRDRESAEELIESVMTTQKSILEVRLLPALHCSPLTYS